jgi:hypothetical protein
LSAAAAAAAAVWQYDAGFLQDLLLLLQRFHPVCCFVQQCWPRQANSTRYVPSAGTPPHLQHRKEVAKKAPKVAMGAPQLQSAAALTDLTVS